MWGLYGTLHSQTLNPKPLKLGRDYMEILIFMKKSETLKTEKRKPCLEGNYPSLLKES